MTGSQVAWPARSGTVPPLAPEYMARPESGPEVAFRPGTAVAFVPPQERASAEAGERPRGQGAAVSPDWLSITGKTQLAVDMAESAWRARSVEALIWVTASSRASVLSGCARAASELLGGNPGAGAEVAATRLLSWIGETSRPWLLVLDDLRRADDLRGLFPAGPAGMVLITTSDLLAIPAGRRVRSVQVGPFTQREALSYLRSRLGADPGQRDGMIELAAELGGEPLALAQAGGTVASSRLTCRDYVRDYIARRNQISRSAGGRPAAASVTWTFSAEQADRLSDGMAWSLVTLAALMDGNGFPASILNSAAVTGYLGAGPGLDEALLSAEQAGLLVLDPAATPPAVWLNRALQSAVRASAANSPLLAEAADAAASGLEQAWPDNEPAPWAAAALRDSTACLRAFAGPRLWAGGCHPVLLHAGESLDIAQLTDAAQAYWNDLMTTVSRTLGQDHADALRIARHLADARLRAGHTASAVRLFEWRHEMLASTLGPEHPESLSARLDLGRALSAAGQHETAIDVLTKTAADYDRGRGPGQPETATAWEQLAAAFEVAGRHGDAVRLLRRTLADRERLQGPRHPDTLATRRSLAAACLADGQFKDALGHAKRVLADSERLYGEDHLETIGARGALGAAYRAAGRMASAVQLLEEARQGLDRALGAEHPITLSRRADLARAYYQVGRLSDATALLRDTLSRCERALPPGDPLTAMVRETLASIAGA